MSHMSLREPQASQPYKLEETITEENVQFISQLKNSRKNKLKTKESQNRQTGDTAECAIKNQAQRCEEGQNTSTLNDSSSNSGSSKKRKLERKRTAIESDENFPPQEMNDADNAHQILDFMDLPVKVKNSKKKKMHLSPEIQSSDNFSARIEHHRPSPETINGAKSKKNRNVGANPDPKGKSMSRNDDGVQQRGRKYSLSVHQSNIVMGGNRPLSSPIALTKSKRGSKVNGHDKNEDITRMSDLSQDLFITQKQFLSSEGSSGDSPPLGQEQGSGIRDWVKSQNFANAMQLLSQFSCLTRNSLDTSSSGSNQQVALRETATQTDDNFTYLALMSFVKKVQVSETCSQEALDLSLPSRIRAKREVLSPSDDVIVIESQSPPVGASIKSEIKCCFGPFLKIEQTKLVQTVLNSNYFFKGKGEPGDTTPIRPILKIKQKPKKRTKRSGKRETK
ncbi:uncharacterized protein LOC142660454 [Rhinoderma darwinii]|uniref:uncharacterized protein LOC142660454 n=1 Tax=Rhinoderma darwinii TaxID=43563 RepID=UPI003F669074